MSRIEKTFKALNRKTFIAFIMAGDPDLPKTAAIMERLPESGADIIELGMPFTDPVADGPAIQTASQRALKNKITLGNILNLVQNFRKENDKTPIVLMGYANPVFSYGFEKFAQNAKSAGVDGLIIVDLPPEEDEELRVYTEQHDINLIRLLTPTTNQIRLKQLLKGASGFLYYVSVAGVTGDKSADLQTIKPHLEMIKSKTDLPLTIGFGIKTGNDVKAMASLAEGVVVGSAIVKEIENHGQSPNLPDIVAAKVKELAGGLK